MMIKNINYSKFKLCLLSILWRAHISTHKFFKRVDVFKNADTIGKMLLENDCKSEELFKISVVCVQGLDEYPPRITVNPTVVKMGGGYLAMFLINGFFYFIDLLPESDFKIFDKVYLKTNGELEVLLLNGGMAKDFLKSFGLPIHIVDNFLLI